MKISDFRLGQWWVSNDWAIKIEKKGRKYLIKVVLESDCVVGNIKKTDDPVINLQIDKFCYMFVNKSFIDFIEKWGSILKASDVTQDVLDNICVFERECTKKELEKLLSQYTLGKSRYMGKDRNINIDEILLQYNQLNEEDKDWE